MRVILAAMLLAAVSGIQPGIDPGNDAPPQGLRVTTLPAGTVEIHQPIVVMAGGELRGAQSGTTIHLAADFRGRAAVIALGESIVLDGFSIDGNRSALEVRQGLPAYDQPFERFTANDGILLSSPRGARVENVQLRNIAGFAILVYRGANVEITHVTVEDSGARTETGRNNATGGILFEEGVADFRVEACTFRNILGNALWTHSLYTSPRNQRGVFARNLIDTVGRDAIQIGHATRMTVADNIATRIGFPAASPAIDPSAIPVGIDTAGNVDRTLYIRNRISEIDGKCMDLDGLHDSEIRGNACVNGELPKAYPLGNYAIVMNDTNPDMRTSGIRIVENRIERPVFGAVFVIGEHNLIARNLLLDLNTAHCNQNLAEYQCLYAPADPHILESGIYFGRGAERPAPARENVVEENWISGWGMKSGCVASAPDIPRIWNTVRGNHCF